MSRMFKSITRTWNVFKGCRYECVYCCARALVEGRLKNSPRYLDGFKPHLIEEELRRRFKPGEFIFVAYMGDISFATTGQILRILARIMDFPETDFLLQTKNPSRLYDRPGLTLHLPLNIVFGTTIETNRDYGLSKAPPPEQRFKDFVNCRFQRKFLSIEPICDFDLDTMVRWVEELQPEIIEVGADNYHHHLPEPPPEKVEALLNYLHDICPRVVEKEGLERLKR